MAKKEPTVNIPKSEMEALARALLADEYGVSEDAYEILSKYIPPSIADEVDATDGRYYLPEDELEDEDEDEDEEDEYDDFEDDEDDDDDEDE
jgi:hypothetical protein